MAPDRNWLNVVLVAAIAILLIASAGLAWTVKINVRPPSEVERTLGEFRATPLVGTAMKDNPDAAAKIRAAIEEDIASPLQAGVPSRAFYAVGELSRDHIRPMLAAADDASVVAVLAARFALASHMREVDPSLCRNFAMSSVLNVESFDTRGQALFKAFVAAMEAAYANGRAAGGTAQPVASVPEMTAMLREAGFTQLDMDDLGRFASLSATRACDIDLKIDGAPPRLPVAERAPFARYVLTH